MKTITKENIDDAINKICDDIAPQLSQKLVDNMIECSNKFENQEDSIKQTSNYIATLITANTNSN